ncbi:MAG: hypothetical protein IPP77_00330 [Bacteroidetes bacterium]|nr:hypothetical protein [Bacteroidota bacterium]
MLQLSSINYEDSKIIFQFDGQLIRTAYLLSDRVLVGGATVFPIDYDKNWGNLSPLFKKKMVLEYSSRVSNPQYLTDVKNGYEYLDLQRKTVKHETKDQIIQRKKLEKWLEAIFQASRKDLKDAFEVYGYLELALLKDTGELSTYISDSENPESAQKGNLPFSNLLRQYWTGEIQAYCFTHPFWEYLEEQKIAISPYDKADKNTRVITFRLPDLPPINQLTAAELKFVKQQIFPEMQAMRKAIEDWPQILKAEDFGNVWFPPPPLLFFLRRKKKRGKKSSPPTGRGGRGGEKSLGGFSRATAPTNPGGVEGGGGGPREESLAAIKKPPPKLWGHHGPPPPPPPPFSPPQPKEVGARGDLGCVSCCWCPI